MIFMCLVQLQSAETLMIGLTKWKQLSVKPHILPPEADRLLMIQVHTSVTTTKSDKFKLPGIFHMLHMIIQKQPSRYYIKKSGYSLFSCLWISLLLQLIRFPRFQYSMSISSSVNSCQIIDSFVKLYKCHKQTHDWISILSYS